MMDQMFAESIKIFQMNWIKKSFQFEVIVLGAVRKWGYVEILLIEQVMKVWNAEISFKIKNENSKFNISLRE